MAIKANQKYNGVVRPGSTLMETSTGTVGYQVMLSCEDGETYFIIWLTEKNRQRATKAFEALGVPMVKLSQPLFLEVDLGQIIEGKEVAFGTREDTYNNQTTIKVAWIGKKSEGNLSKDAAAFFNKQTSPQNIQNREDEQSDPIPF